MTAEGATNPLRSPIFYYGGKGAQCARIASLLPPHTHYVEPFAGGLSVLLAKKPSALETINDVHNGLVTLYRVLRDPLQHAALYALLELTPYARAEYEACRRAWPHETEPVRKAWAFFVCARQCFGGHHVTPGWSYSVSAPGSQPVSRWLSAIEGLPALHARLRRVQIEHGDWQRVLERYETPDTLVYADPPYAPCVRAEGGRGRYHCEMTTADHEALVAVLLAYRGMVVLSGYRHALYEPLERAGWERRDHVVPLASSRHNAGQTRTESLWRNPAALRAWQAALWPLFSGGSASGEGAAR